MSIIYILWQGQAPCAGRSRRVMVFYSSPGIYIYIYIYIYMKSPPPVNKCRPPLKCLSPKNGFILRRGSFFRTVDFPWHSWIGQHVLWLSCTFQMLSNICIILFSIIRKILLIKLYYVLYYCYYNYMYYILSIFYSNYYCIILIYNILLSNIF